MKSDPPAGGGPPWPRTILIWVAVCLAVLAVVALASGGLRMTLGPLRISATDPYRLLLEAAAIWLIAEVVSAGPRRRRGISLAIGALLWAAVADSSPARVGEAITVGSSTRTDFRSSFSNFGSVVDIFAPGSAIVSAFNTSDTALATLSGTSMAAPHVAGVAARYLQSAPAASPAQVRNEIVSTDKIGNDTRINNATTNRLSGIPSGTANRLLFWSSSR